MMIIAVEGLAKISAENHEKLFFSICKIRSIHKILQFKYSQTSQKKIQTNQQLVNLCHQYRKYQISVRQQWDLTVICSAVKDNWQCALLAFACCCPLSVRCLAPFCMKS